MSELIPAFAGLSAGLAAGRGAVLGQSGGARGSTQRTRSAGDFSSKTGGFE
jgi:hypothetical protein